MINEQIRDKEVRLIGSDGEQLGIMSAKEAMFKAQEAGLDLVKIAPQAKPPVCKIIDYGKYRYELARKEKEAKKKQKTIDVKEVRLSPNIDTNDLNTKAGAARKFLTKGDRVKVTLRFRGREMAHMSSSKHVLDDFAEMLSEWLGELNVSHTGGRYYSNLKGDATANLGLLYDWSYDGKGLLISEVVEKGPFDHARSKVKAGDIVFVLPGQLHSIKQKKEARMEYENILFQPSMLLCGEPDLCGTDFILPLMENPATIQTFLTPDAPAYESLSGCIRKIDNLCDSRPKGYQLAVKGWLFQFMFYLVSNQQTLKQPSQAHQKHMDKLKTILKYVEEHYNEPLSIEDMANLIHYSKSHFMKFFKTHMNMGFTQYLNHYRMQNF